MIKKSMSAFWRGPTQNLPDFYRVLFMVHFPNSKAWPRPRISPTFSVVEKVGLASAPFSLRARCSPIGSGLAQGF
jgi:hypothetical protein